MIDEHQNGSHDDGELETPNHNVALKGQAQVALDIQMTTFEQSALWAALGQESFHIAQALNFIAAEDQ